MGQGPPWKGWMGGGDLGRRLQGWGLQQLHPGTAIRNPLLLVRRAGSNRIVLTEKGKMSK